MYIQNGLASVNDYITCPPRASSNLKVFVRNLVHFSSYHSGWKRIRASNSCAIRVLFRPNIYEAASWLTISCYTILDFPPALGGVLSMADAAESKTKFEDSDVPESTKIAPQSPEPDFNGGIDKSPLTGREDWREVKMGEAHDKGDEVTVLALDANGPSQDKENTLEPSPFTYRKLLSPISTPQQPPAPPEKDLPADHPPPTPEKEGFHKSARRPNSSRSGSAHPSAAQAGSDSNEVIGRVPLSSITFVVAALENIAASKEARKRKPLETAVQKALAVTKQPNGSPDPEVIFEPLRLATQSASVLLVTASLDCIGKLISYSYFSAGASENSSRSSTEEPKPPLIDRAIETICNCFEDETTPAEVQLQIVKSLLAAVLNDKFIVHGSGLLRAVRQVYNIFLLSKSSANQQVAQGTLTQMVGTVFERVTVRLAMKEARINMSRLTSEKGTANGSQIDVSGTNSAIGSIEADGGVEADGLSETSLAFISDRPARKEPGEKLTLKSFENVDDAKIGDNPPTMVTQARPAQRSSRTASGLAITLANGDADPGGREISDEDEEDDIFVRDAYLVFRSMCRLSEKQLQPDQQQDIKSSNMRSKLISLAIMRMLLNNNMAVFTSPVVIIRSTTNNEPTSFGQAITQYLRLSLSKNGASSVRQVFETCCEIFWLMLKDMRLMLKVYRPTSPVSWVIFLRHFD